MAWDRGLSGKALSIAATECRYMRVMAGPGTGKTFAMKRRVARLLEEEVDAERLFVVTFTRVAAGSLVKELRELGVEGCEAVKAGTLHSFCFGTLKRQEVFEYLGRVPRPLVTFSKSGALQFEAAPLVADISTEGARKAAKRIRAFEAAWARRQSETPGWPHDARDRNFHRKLIAWLTFHRAMLIGELVPEILRYLRDNPEAPERSAFDHVIVDEYQDLNRADQALLDLLTYGNGVVIGDENQSIYRFRYAHPQGIGGFDASHDPTHDEDLDECRRCPTRVVALANSLIMHNHPAAAEPQLLPKRGNPEGEVHIVQWRSMDNETDGIADYVHSLVDGGDGYESGDILILSPRRQLAYKVRDALKNRDVAAHSFYHEEALEEDAAQTSFAYLTLLADPEDRVSLRFLLGQGSSTWLAGQYEKLRAHCEQNGLSPIEALDGIVRKKVNLTGVNKLIERYKTISRRLKDLKKCGAEDLVEALFPEGKEETQLLRVAALSMLEKDHDIEPASILERLRNLITQPEMPETADFVRIMSLQKSKGLTSKVVIVLGCIEGLTPSVDRKESAIEQAEILREQRRVFYVAMTRPTEILVLSSFITVDRKLAYRIGATVRYGTGASAPTIASRFLSELGPTAPDAKSGTAWQRNGYE
jgi:DNA helicase-2/ATP-dependent DNA helicase PcrA